MKFSATFIFALAAAVTALPAPETDNSHVLEARQSCRLLISSGDAGSGTCLGRGRLCRVNDSGVPGGVRTEVSSECSV
ncbi:hypothetical protein PgNI_10185 [Pyricularia grisea]|uniref:Uncharacterized protein n=1 Tax=Pyricularia grisea TaxID=148305 RepID=A0A6P8AY14_PYRGI|nr:hypothetical protein PgNI_10185 [Pyricularia grisea]TLD07240.1 hypothetical protein PgNI_10185 [Pyricularia grisea]